MAQASIAFLKSNILMRLLIEIGDTTYVISAHSSQKDQYAIVVDTETVEFNGENRSKFTISDLQSGGLTRVLYEGIGSELYILDPTRVNFEGASVLLCHKKNDENFPLDHESSYPFECDKITQTPCYFNEESYWKWNYFGDVNNNTAHVDIEHELLGNEIVGINNLDYVSLTHSRRIQSYDLGNNLIETTVESNDVFLRQEGQKIYRFINDMDCLLYDFDMDNGDIVTFNNCQEGGNSSEDHKVKGVFTFIWNGELRRYFDMEQLSYPYDWYRIYEGIGSWQDWLNPSFQNNNEHAELICHQKKGEEAPIYYYTDYSIESCNSFLVGTDLPQFSELNIFPNPGSDFIKLTSENESFETIKIYDTSGVLIQNNSVDKNATEHEIDISKLTPGLYFISIKSQGHQFMEKFMKI